MSGSRPESANPADDTAEQTQQPAPEASAEAQEAEGTYRVALPSFEGPLDLLLHLIQTHELDILDIPIGFITEKYLGFLELMKDLNIDIASEYLVMAATLTHIKSKMLLPPSPDDEEDAGEDGDLDPRAELVRRLLEYQKYKLAAEQLGERHVLGRDVFTRGVAVEVTTDPAPLAPVSLFKLLDAFQAILTRSKQLQDHQIDFERISITERINQLSDILRERQRVKFEELFPEGASRADLIVTFLALLEMTRLRLTLLVQAGPLEPIEIELAVQDDAEEGDEAQGTPLEDWDEPGEESDSDVSGALSAELQDAAPLDAEGVEDHPPDDGLNE